MTTDGRLRWDLGAKDTMYLDHREQMTVLSVFRAIKQLDGEGRKWYSMTRLVRTSFDLRIHEFITDNKIRRIIVLLVAHKPKLLHVRQKGNFRIVTPSETFRVKYLPKSPRI